MWEWPRDPIEAQAIQRQLAGQVSRRVELGPVAAVVGVDVHFLDGGRKARGAAVALSYPGLDLLEVAIAEEEVRFPYIPGLLAFREAPVLVAAIQKLSAAPDLVLVDGQGIAHPRRMGIASHLGVLLEMPTIGCAKSRLLGTHGSVSEAAGAWAELKDQREVIGAVLRTKAGTTPLYVSIGHRVDLETAREWVLRCCRGYRLPEPTRLAHLAAGSQLRSQPIRAQQGVQGTRVQAGPLVKSTT